VERVRAVPERAGGVTEWLKVAAYAASHGVLMAPHHDAQIHGHLVAAVPNGHVLENSPIRCAIRSGKSCSRVARW
jgi:L-alanine-DL-glutamate epimerase-like enolase superfamily enzyme